MIAHFFCKFCNIQHDNSIRAGLALMCRDAKNYLRLKDKSLSFDEYKENKNKPKRIIDNNEQVRCYQCLEFKNHSSINFITHYKKLTNLCKACKAESSRIERSKKEKIIKKTKHQLALENGVFNCNHCKKDRDVNLKIDQRRNTCKVCMSYKVHEKRYNKLTFNEYEENYFYSAKLNSNYIDQCFVCRKRKTDDELRVQGAKRNMCQCCYSKSERSIKQLTQKNLTSALRRHGISEHRFESIFGYSKKDFIESMKSKLNNGMTAEDLFSSSVHIDHVTPSALFDLTNEDHFNYCWSLDNLQPMWASENNKKLDYLPNGDRVSIIKRQPNARQRLDELLLGLYGLSFKPK